MSLYRRSGFSQPRAQPCRTKCILHSVHRVSTCCYCCYCCCCVVVERCRLEIMRLLYRKRTCPICNVVFYSRLERPTFIQSRSHSPKDSLRACLLPTRIHSTPSSRRTWRELTSLETKRCWKLSSSNWAWRRALSPLAHSRKNQESRTPNVASNNLRPVMTTTG